MAVAAPAILAGLPVQAPPASFPASASSPSRPALDVSVTAGPGAPRAGHSYGYLVSIANPEPGPAWLVHLSLSVPAGTAVAAVGGGGSCRIGRDSLRCDWGELPGRSALGLSVAVSLGPGISAGMMLTASAVVGYDWGLLARATSIGTVAAPPRPRQTPRPRPTPRPRRTPSPPARTPNPQAPPSRPTPAQLPPAGAPPASSPPFVTGAAPGTPRPPRPSRSPSPAAFFPGTAAELLAPAPRQPAPGLPVGVLLAVILVPCAAAAVTRFGRRR